VKALAFVLCVASVAASQSTRPFPYLLRISHETFDDYSCALLQTSGAFHLEFAHGVDVKVYEGTTNPEDVLKVQHILERPELAGLSQEQIEEPIVRGRTEKLQLTIYRQHRWQDLFFQSVESELPFKESVEPLVGWLDNLHKLPHKEFSEDAGVQHCLPPTEIALKKRDAEPPPPHSFTSTEWAVKSVLNLPPLASPATSAPAPIRPLLRVYSFAVKTSDARQFCTLIAENGRYRLENHYQKMGKSVSTEVTAGTLNPEELAQLHALLDNPGLLKIRHHEPRGSTVVPMLGDMMNLSIMRQAGEQNVILSSSYGRQFGSFYGGDADTSVARNLTKFLSDHIENRPAEVLQKSAQNNCTELP
jgi:hypothetical protein